jgi:hypothetical protein
MFTNLQWKWEKLLKKEAKFLCLLKTICLIKLQN